MCAKRESERLTAWTSPSNMMLTALQTNPGSSSVFALHSSPAPSSAQQDQSTNHSSTHLDNLAALQSGGMNNKPSPSPPSSASSSTTTINYQGLTPHLIPMATVPPSQVLIGSSTGGYTILPSITSLSGAEGSFGNLASLHPIAAAGAGFTQASASTAPITAIQATYYPQGHHPPPPTPEQDRTSAGAGGGGGGGAEMYRRSNSSPVAPAVQQQQLATSTAANSDHHSERHSPHSHSHSRTGGHTRILQNGNQTQNPSDTKPIMDSLLLLQQQHLLNQQQQAAASSSLRSSRVGSDGVLTSSSSDPSLHHSSSLASSDDGGRSSERLGGRLDPTSLSSSSPSSSAGSGHRRASHNAIMHLSSSSGGNGGGGAPIEIKREPPEDSCTIITSTSSTSGGVVHQSCTSGRRHSDSSSSVDAVSAVASNNISVSGAPSSSSKSSPYPVSALIDVPMITPLNRSSRTSSLSSSLSSFRFGGSLSQLWASQISLSGKISNMKSTGNLNAEAATMPSLGNQYFAFGGSLPELSLTSLTRLLPNSSANDPNISSCPSLFTLFHPPLYVYPSQQHLTTPFINANGSISFGSFLSSGTSLCSMQKTSSGGSIGNGNGITSNSSNLVTSLSSSSSAATSSNNSTIITGKANKVDDSPGAYGRAPLAAHQQQANDAVSKLSTMYSPIIGGAQVITALPGFSTIAAARGFNTDQTAAAAAAGVPQSNSGSITSHTITASTHSNLTPLYSTAVAPTSTVTHVAAPNCNLNTLACVATAQMQRQGMSPPNPRPPPHHLPITHPSTDPHLHQPHQPHHGAATTPTPTGGGGALGGSATTPTHDSKEGILAAMHGSAGATNTGAAIEVYNIGGGNSAAALISAGAVNVNRIEIKGDHHGGRLTQSPVDMSQAPHGHGVSPLMSVDMSQPHLRGAHQQADMSPGGSGSGGSGGGMKMKKEKDKPYKCDHPGCGRSFSFPAHLRSHIQQIHISYRPCKCEFPGCGKRFYTPQHLNVHRRVHTGERPFICPYADCGKAFTTAGNLKNHIRTHTGERPYACKYDGCLKRFAEMSSLKKHELTHTGEKPYKCRVCGKAFSQAGSRNTHERKHNPVAEEGDVPGDQVGKSNRRYRIKRVPVVANGTASITSPGTIVEDPSSMQH